MAKREGKVKIGQIPSGVPNLDTVLGGGIPAYSINVVAGPPGSGKTTLVQQILFHNATRDQRALHLAALSEPLLKLIRYQQQFDFFDPSKVTGAITYFDIGKVAREEGLKRTLEVIQQQVNRVTPSFLAIDSFKALEELSEQNGDYGIRAFVHDLSTYLAGWQITSFLVGEYTRNDLETLSEFSVADGILWLEQEVRQNSVLRKLRVIKCRGQKSVPGLHTFRISEEGILLFPRALPLPEREVGPAPEGRAAFGVAGLDDMMRGGIPIGETVLVAGSSGTGKTLLSLHFIMEGARKGEPGVMVTFEEHPREHERKAVGFGWDLGALEKVGADGRPPLLKMIYLRPIDLSVDEVLYHVHQSARELGAKRVVINSISGFELSLSPADREDFREALYRLLATLTGEGVTALLTTEVPDLMGTDVRISPHGISFLADNAILLRYVEIESQLQKALMVVKMRTSDHDKELRRYNITSKGVTVEKAFTEYSGVLSGIPTLRTVMGPQPFTTGLTEQEEALMHVLLALPDSTVEQLAEGMGVKLGDAQRMVDKLVETGYVFRSSKAGKTVYRVALIAPAAPPRRGK